ncbi:unnamed protein product [Brassica rapa]|uniref:Uncharacterized protein n=1 Tax=Brassica campestris TaxID=3711 RepID=A0A8D9HCQ1_BRACM|nr:unnamed protein product [Brassica rapa]
MAAKGVEISEERSEYHAVTGLQCHTSLSRKELVDFEDDGGFWSIVVRRKEGVTILDLWKNHHEAVKKWSNADRISFLQISAHSI